LQITENCCKEQHRKEEDGKYIQCDFARLPAAVSGAASPAAFTTAA